MTIVEAPEPPTSPVLRQHISVPAAARLLDVDPRVIYGLVKRNEIPALRVGRTIRLAVEDLEEAFSCGPIVRRPRPAAPAPKRARRPKGRFKQMARAMAERESATPDPAT